jgi:hypothetical protein
MPTCLGPEHAQARPLVPPATVHWALVAAAVILAALFARAYYQDLSSYSGDGAGLEVFHDTRF